MQEFKAELRRRRVNGMTAHARWAARHLASVVKLAVTDRRPLVSVFNDMRSMIPGILTTRYRVNPVLTDYALDCTRQILGF